MFARLTNAQEYHAEAYREERLRQAAARRRRNAAAAGKLTFAQVTAGRLGRLMTAAGARLQAAAEPPASEAPSYALDEIAASNA